MRRGGETHPAGGRTRRRTCQAERGRGGAGHGDRRDVPPPPRGTTAAGAAGLDFTERTKTNVKLSTRPLEIDLPWQCLSQGRDPRTGRPHRSHGLQGTRGPCGPGLGVARCARVRPGGGGSAKVAPGRGRGERPSTAVSGGLCARRAGPGRLRQAARWQSRRERTSAGRPRGRPGSGSPRPDTR